jgi:hypothetical protein
MPYRVYEATELEALLSPEGDTAGTEAPRSNRLQDALNQLEEEGYTLVAIEPAEQGPSYIFHRDDPDPDTRARLNNMR